ncbi:copper homeostasis protein CutC [Streptomyces sp. NPDC059828]|uniref:copper homeostasis protein CutC n=1 Tax=Streptomyces sp. NPDC059828 TaxID=3346965 RepID=UPI003660BF29
MGNRNRALLEVIVLDALDAVAAEASGADRIELVSDIAADGIIPAPGTFASVRAAVDIPVRVMLRLTGRFTAGDARDIERLVRATQVLRAAGADEFVLGFLDVYGNPDLVTVERLVAEIDDCRWTFHRAIDRAADRDTLRKHVADLPGLDTFLTAGSPAGVDQGLPVVLAEAARQGEPGYEARLMVGGGLRLDHLPALRAGGIDAFHIGSAARPAGWATPVDPEAVREWRRVLDAA